MESNKIKANPTQYSFENNTLKVWKYFPFIRKSFAKDKVHFTNNIGIDINSLRAGSEDKMMFDRFCSANLYNINWYRQHIFRKKAVIIFYNWLSLILLIGVPFLIFIMTNGDTDPMESMSPKEMGMVEHTSELSDSLHVNNPTATKGVDSVKAVSTNENQSATNNKARLSAMESIGAGLLLLISSFLGLQKFVGQWIEKRKTRAHFNKASIQLKTILYTLQDEFFKNSLVIKNNYEEEGEYIFSQSFFTALKKATNDSVRVINEETQLYFESVENPIFDLGNIWQTSANTAREVINTFKSPKFNIEEVREQVKKEAQEKAKKEATVTANKKRMEMIILKLKSIGNKEERISLKMDELEEIAKNAELSTHQQNRYNALETEFDQLQEQSETLELEYQQKELENAMLTENQE